MSRPTIRIDIACNDPDNGLFQHRVTEIQVAGQMLELVAKQWGLLSPNRCPRFEEKSGAIVLSGKRWPIVRSREWFGNWCWNAYWFEVETARDFLQWLHRRRLFNVECGDSGLFDMWKADAPLRLDGYVAALARATVEERDG